MQTIRVPSDTYPRKLESKKDERQLRNSQPLSITGTADRPTLPSRLGGKKTLLVCASTANETRWERQNVS